MVKKKEKGRENNDTVGNLSSFIESQIHLNVSINAQNIYSSLFNIMCRMVTINNTSYRLNFVQRLSARKVHGRYSKNIKFADVSLWKNLKETSYYIPIYIFNCKVVSFINFVVFSFNFVDVFFFYYIFGQFLSLLRSALILDFFKTCSLWIIILLCMMHFYPTKYNKTSTVERSVVFVTNHK